MSILTPKRKAFDDGDLLSPSTSSTMMKSMTMTMTMTMTAPYNHPPPIHTLPIELLVSIFKFAIYDPPYPYPNPEVDPAPGLGQDPEPLIHMAVGMDPIPQPIINPASSRHSIPTSTSASASDSASDANLDSDFVVLLCRVCKRWNGIVMGTPSLWGRLVLVGLGGDGGGIGGRYEGVGGSTGVGTGKGSEYGGNGKAKGKAKARDESIYYAESSMDMDIYDSDVDSDNNDSETDSEEEASGLASLLTRDDGILHSHSHFHPCSASGYVLPRGVCNTSSDTISNDGDSDEEHRGRKPYARHFALQRAKAAAWFERSRQLAHVDLRIDDACRYLNAYASLDEQGSGSRRAKRRRRRYGSAHLDGQINLNANMDRNMNSKDVDMDAALPLLSYALPEVHRWGRVEHRHARMRFITVRDGKPNCVESLSVSLVPRKRGVGGGVARSGEGTGMGTGGVGVAGGVAGGLVGAIVNAMSMAHLSMSGYSNVHEPSAFITTNLFNPQPSPSSSSSSSHSPDTRNKYTDRLREVYILGVRVLPPPSALRPFETVTMLRLGNNSTECAFPTHEVVPFLRAFPVVECLEMVSSADVFAGGAAALGLAVRLGAVDPSGYGYVRRKKGKRKNIPPGYRTHSCRALKPVHLPKLKVLIVTQIYDSRCLLSHLVAPALEKLHLVHINSSIGLEVVMKNSVQRRRRTGAETGDSNDDGKGVEGEEGEALSGWEVGDSEDEAGDFSRSPWTDHATGMGLRQFFSRNSDDAENAPVQLKELIMNYADLRTKDFIWLFRQATKLEKFTIVASDMSDNVIRALSVPHDDGDGDGSSDLDGGGHAQVLLPALQTLRLVRCHKVTGAALVDMVSSRLRASVSGSVPASGSGSGSESEKRVATMETLHVLQCARVTAMDVATLNLPVDLTYVPGVEGD